MDLDTAIALVHGAVVLDDPHGAWSARAAVRHVRDAIDPAEVDVLDFNPWNNRHSITDEQLRDAYRMVLAASAADLDTALTQYSPPPGN